MFKKSSFILLVAGLVTVFAIVSKITSNTPIIENYWDSGVAMNTQVETMCKSPNGDYFVDVPGNYATASPVYNRPGSPGGFGANINYNIPSTENLAFVPGETNPWSEKFPMNQANRVEPQRRSQRENFTQNQQDKIVDTLASSGGALPTGDMKCSSKIPYCVQRPFVTLMKRPGYFLGDPIRGDLAIPPNKCDGWFKPSGTPVNTLRTGAMGAMFGEDGESTRDTANLVMGGMGDAGMRPVMGALSMPQKDTYSGSLTSMLSPEALNKPVSAEKYQARGNTAAAENYQVRGNTAAINNDRLTNAHTYDGSANYQRGCA